MGCKKISPLENQIANIEMDVEIERFDLALKNVTTQNIDSLREKYPYLLTHSYDNSSWLELTKDSLFVEITNETSTILNDVSQEEKELKKLMQHISYYFPEKKNPKIIGLTSEVRYQEPIIWADSIVLIGLDNYLGATHHFYKNLPKYISKHRQRSSITKDVATAFTDQIIPSKRMPTFIESVINEGKRLYLLELLMPFKNRNQMIGYTPKEWDWAVANTKQIWIYFIEHNLFYDTDIKLYNRFIAPAPFTKFYLDIDHESPGELGRFIGWKIVKKFMQKENFTWKEMLSLDPLYIFNSAKYKP